MIPEAQASHTQHYMPVLRAKRSEWDALAAITPAVRGVLLPLIELPPDLLEQGPPPQKRPKKPTPRPSPTEFARTKLQEFAAHAMEAAAAGRVLVDIGHCATTNFVVQGVAVWDTLLAVWAGHRPAIGLVLHLTWPDAVLTAATRLLGSLGGGAALRLTRSDLARPDLGARIDAVLRACGLTPEQTHLVVDLANGPSAISYRDLARRLPHLTSWRTYTVVAGCFPPNLNEDDVERHLNPHDRTEWHVWWRQVAPPVPGAPTGDAARPARLPAFGDFTTQCACYAPSPRIAGSFSVRYTTDTHILVYRGYKPDAQKGRTGNQFIGHARALCSAPHIFYGWAFSAGDEQIFAKAHPSAVGPGGAQYWRTAGINHHMTTTVAQVRSPDGTSTRARAAAAARGPWTPPATAARPAAPRRSASRARRAAAIASQSPHRNP